MTADEWAQKYLSEASDLSEEVLDHILDLYDLERG